MTRRDPDPTFPPRPRRDRRERIRARLVAWYRAAQRDLPWRATRDPYAIWVSEAMLQQTRVETVLGYWGRFLARFPTARALAAASEEEVLSAWSGLGYYRRARALHAGAKAIVEHHGGRFPRRRKDALALPGVGPYTAGAVLSIAFDAPEALVDGNVERVFSRLFGLDAVAGSGALAAECWALAELMVPRAGGCGEWNQALMELGATVCTPKLPRCGGCPLARSCRARRTGRETDLPRPKPRLATLPVELEILVVERPGHVGQVGRLLLERRPAGGRMARLLQFPTRAVRVGARRASALFPATWPGPESGLAAGERLGELRHTITKHRIHATVYRGRLTAPGAAARAPLVWIPREEAWERALTGMTRKVLRILGQEYVATAD
ncbi:MAG: A/G-specific adenine glycosylase [Planctomycetota bacterium]|nr:MAG: A/G-specific adenine glycosylase [Planctomycetota bacterium]